MNLKKFEILAALLFIGIVIWSLSSMMKHADKKAAALFEEYPKMRSRDAVFGRITNIKFFDRNNRFNPSFACFTIDDHSKYSVSVSRERTSEFALMDLLQPQMYLSKKPSNDTLELRLDSAELSPIYRFVLYW